MPVQGVRTGEFGRWLTYYLDGLKAYKLYHVYYDHGDRSLEANVVATKGFFGNRVSNLNRLADVDVAVVGPDGKARLLIEIEERACSPKKILGNILANLICNRYAVRAVRKMTAQHYFEVDAATRLVIAGVVPTKGSRLKKIESVILPRVRQLQGLADGIHPANIELLFSSNFSDTVAALQQFVAVTFPV